MNTQTEIVVFDDSIAKRCPNRSWSMVGVDALGTWLNEAGYVGQPGSTGLTGDTGATGSAGVNAYGSPNSRSLSLATAYQATDPTKPAQVMVNLTSTAALTLSGGTTNTADVLIGSTNAVASGTGSVVGKYANTNTGAVVIGVNLSTVSTVPLALSVPTGWYFAIRQTAGSVSIVSAFDQSVG